MSSSATITYALSQETGFATELCKLALERARHDVNAAKRILAHWGGKSPTPSDNFGVISTYFDNDAAAIVEVKCTDELFAGTKEFYNLVEEITTEIVQYEHHYVTEPALEKLEKEHECKFTVTSTRFVKTNKLSLLTTYTHQNRVGVILETSVTNEDAFNSSIFRLFSFDCALHIAAFAPLAIDKTDIPADIRANLSRQIEKDLMKSGKAMHLWSMVIDGKIGKWAEQRSLMNQIFIKNDKETVEDVRKKISEKIGSEIKINRFARMLLGS